MKNQEEDRKSYRKIYLSRSDIRKLFNIPSHVEIRGVQIDNDPLSVQILLTSDFDKKPWPSSEFTEPNGKVWDDDGFEDNESSILHHNVWWKWQNQ